MQLNITANKVKQVLMMLYFAVKHKWWMRRSHQFIEIVYIRLYANGNNVSVYKYIKNTLREKHKIYKENRDTFSSRSTYLNKNSYIVFVESNSFQN